jgi:hypothetical protein
MNTFYFFVLVLTWHDPGSAPRSEIPAAYPTLAECQTAGRTVPGTMYYCIRETIQVNTGGNTVGVTVLF